MVYVPHRPEVFFGADYSAMNPYQHLLHQSIGAAASLQPGSLVAALNAQKRSDYPVIYHLHWEDQIFRETPANADRRGAVQRFLDDISAFDQAGGQLVWTRHNLAPHDPSAADLHSALVAHLNAAARLVHVHSWRALEALEAAGQAAIEKTVIIGHGNYIGQYPDWPGPAAHTRLDLAQDAFVFLLFGRLLSYKGVTEAVAAFDELGDERARLLIVGETPDDAPPIRQCDLVRHVPGRVSDADVGLYFAAADAALMPYHGSLTSGVAHLAAGLGRGAIGPDVPGLADLYADGHSALLYDPQDAFGLTRSIRTALLEGPKVWARRGKAAQQSARCRDWGIAARQWIALYRSLAQTPRAGTMDRGAGLEVIAP